MAHEMDPLVTKARAVAILPLPMQPGKLTGQRYAGRNKKGDKRRRDLLLLTPR